MNSSDEEEVRFTRAALQKRPTRGLRACQLFLIFSAVVVLRGDHSLLGQGAVAGAVFFHELGQLLAMRALGYREVRVLFPPLFGRVTGGQRTGPTTWKHVVVLLAGPLPGLVLALALSSGGLHSLLQSEVAWSLLLVNLITLLPFAELDGQRLLEEVLFRRQRHVTLASCVLATVGMFGCGARHHTRLLALCALVSVLPLLRSFQLARVSAQVKSEGIVPPGDVAALGDERVLTLLKRVGSFSMFRRVRANLVRRLVALAQWEPPSLSTWLVGLAAWCATLAVGFGTFALAARGVTYDDPASGYRVTLPRWPTPTRGGEPSVAATSWDGATACVVSAQAWAGGLENVKPALVKGYQLTERAGLPALEGQRLDDASVHVAYLVAAERLFTVATKGPGSERCLDSFEPPR